MSKTQNNSPSLSLAFVLQKYRNQYRLTQRALAEKISVDEKYIIALEKGDYSVFKQISGEDVVRRICFIIGLKFEPLHKMYQIEYSQYQQQNQRKIERFFSHLHVTPQRLRGMMMVGVLGIVILYLGFQGYQIFLRSSIVFADNQETILTDDPLYTVEGTLRQNGQLTLNGEQVTLDSTGTFRIELDLQKGKNILEFIVSRDEKELSRIYKTIYKTL